MCGDNVSIHFLTSSSKGTPPRVWGQLLIRLNWNPLLRNTPTCVGTTHSGASFIKNAPEHPHVCGDNSHLLANVLNGPGTPPRVWGQRGRSQCRTPGQRNTPTCVGTTSRSGRRAGIETEHPHVCGDNVRGTTKSNSMARNTPTCVGTTLGGLNYGNRLKEHPHVCGDNGIFFAFKLIVEGTPPRVWGQRPFLWM